MHGLGVRASCACVWRQGDASAPPLLVLCAHRLMDAVLSTLTQGGAVYNSGTFTATNCEFSGNTAVRRSLQSCTGAHRLLVPALV